MKLSVQNGDLTVSRGIEGGYAAIKNAGFEAIDWNIDHAWKSAELKTAEKYEGHSIFERPMDEIMAFYAPELAVIRKNGLEITQAHAPFPPYFTGKPEFTDYATEIYKQVVLFCSEVGCPRLVIHSVAYRPDEGEDRDLEYVNGLSMKMYRALIPSLLETRRNGKTAVTVCLENLFSSMNGGYILGPCTDPEEAVWMIDTLNAEAGEECFGLCLDTGHLNLLRGDFRSYIPKLGKRIKALHIHDNFADGDRHLMPYTGNVRWKDLLCGLKKIGYDGDLSFETFAQYLPSRIPDALVDPFLRLTREIGEYFRDELTR